jgi:hypothetical protein
LSTGRNNPFPPLTTSRTQSICYSFTHGNYNEQLDTSKGCNENPLVLVHLRVPGMLFKFWLISVWFLYDESRNSIFGVSDSSKNTSFFIGEVKRQKVAKQRQQRLRLCMHSHWLPHCMVSDISRTIGDNDKRFFASDRNFGLDSTLSAQSW